MLVHLDEVLDQVAFLYETLLAELACELAHVQVHPKVVLEVVDSVEQQTALVVCTSEDHGLRKVVVVKYLESLVQGRLKVAQRLFAREVNGLSYFSNDLPIHYLHKVKLFRQCSLRWLRPLVFLAYCFGLHIWDSQLPLELLGLNILISDTRGSNRSHGVGGGHPVSEGLTFSLLR